MMIPTKLFQLMLISIIAAGCRSAYQPADTSYTIETAHRKIQRTHPDAQAIEAILPAGIRATHNVVYQRRNDGRSLHLDVFRPKDKQQNYPLVMLIHGGGWIAGAKENVVPMAQQLAAKGYICAAVEYRLGEEAPFPAAVHDLQAALQFLHTNAKRYAIDTSQIAVLGFSAGAQLASLLGTTASVNSAFSFSATGEVQNTVPVHAVLNIDGILSFTHPEAAAEWTGRSANAWLGPYEENKDRWEAASPLAYAGTDTPPFLFVNSGQARFHAGRDDLIAVLQAHNIYYQQHTFEEAPHSFWLVHPWFYPTLAQIEAFLKTVFPKN